MWTTSLIFKILVKVNNHPLVKNSPNPVTLFDKLASDDSDFDKKKLFFVLSVVRKLIPPCQNGI
jgi:hypothetical protein